MYLKKIEIENIGPINAKLEIDLPFFQYDNEKLTLPKPFIIAQIFSDSFAYFTTSVDLF